jgi:hypothetical protein
MQAPSTSAIAAATRSDADFYARLPIFHGFDSIMDPALYRALPEDWMIGLTDVVRSTQAIEGGRYKAVNVAGASVIAALSNGLKGRAFPYVFGGDGASFAVGPQDQAAARDALAATAAWARDELELELRTALVPVGAVLLQGLTVSVARFAPSSNVSYAMFSGGGLAWAERAMRDAKYAVPAAGAGVRPDLTGMSCRWNDIPATRGLIVSLLVAPVINGDASFRTLIEGLLRELETSPEVARPVPDGAPGVGWPPPGLDLEARASRKAGESLGLRRFRVAVETMIAYLVMRFGIRIGGFDPAIYRHDVVQNSDFRKYDDNLRMTLDCTAQLADRIEQKLKHAETEGIARYGMHRQSNAIMTCIVPSISQSNHVHFVDGAAGGYALAARRLKQDAAAQRGSRLA